MSTNTVKLDGQNLTIEQVNLIARDINTKVEVTQDALTKVRAAYDFVTRERQEKITYGVNTGFGPMASYILGQSQLTDLQYNLIRSHAVGMGDPIRTTYVRAAMAVRINTLAKGYSGVSPELITHYANVLNAGITPIIPEHGAVGTSGDLVQLAHIALALIGEGDVEYQGTRMPALEALTNAGLEVYKLQPKEGLALINGTSCMAGIGALLVVEAEQLLNIISHTGVLSHELVGAFDDALSEVLHGVRPHAGQMLVAKTMRELIKGSKRQRIRKDFQMHNHIEEDVKHLDESVQEVYSLRCLPQILGPIFDTVAEVKKVVEVEINSVTDNPIVDVESQSFLHGGNFHGDYVAVAMDKLKMAITKLALLSERRINFFLNPNINNGFPPFMNLEKPGLTLALQGLQFVATSTTALCQSLAFPHNLHTIATNGDNQDVVSMGTDAALLCDKVLDNASIVLAIETIVLLQAMDFINEQSSFSKSSQDLYTEVRKVFATVHQDRNVTAELPKVLSVIRNFKC